MYDDPDDDEDLYDDEDELDEEEAARCPECGGPLHSVSDKCPACGYWLSDADHRAMRSRMSKPVWLRVTAVVVLLMFLLSLLGIAAAIL